jgi:hypothetical protein
MNTLIILGVLVIITLGLWIKSNRNVTTDTPTNVPDIEIPNGNTSEGGSGQSDIPAI